MTTNKTENLMTALRDACDAFDVATAHTTDRGKDVRDLRRAAQKLSADVTGMLDARADDARFAALVADLRTRYGARDQVTVAEVMSTTTASASDVADAMYEVGYEQRTVNWERVFARAGR